MIDLDSPVEVVLGGDRGKKHKAVTERLGLRTVGDLLHHFPRRYLRLGELTRVADPEPGTQLVVVGEIVHSRGTTYTDRRTGKTAMRLETRLRTDGPSLGMTFFAKQQRVLEYYQGRLPVGRRGIFTGQVSSFRGEWQLTNPRMLLFGDQDDEEAVRLLGSLRGLYPVYPLTKGLDSWDLQRAVAFAREVVEDVPDLLPDEVRERHHLPGAREAFEDVHAPATPEQVHAALRRFRFEEALTTQLVLARSRAAHAALGTVARTGGGGLLAAFDAGLPFELTAGQRAVGEEVEADLARPAPMNRLLQGEVGSGKTLVALRAMLRVVDSGGQAVLLAPTEVLAQQHHRSITAMLGDLAGGGMLGGAEEATRVELLTGSMTTAQRRAAMLAVASGEAGLVVGTHALLEDQVSFADLGLVVVDEQHRFGVEQRAALTGKAAAPPHVLVMTATPIPRTVAMTVFGDLETSVLRELPAGRAEISTTVVPVAAQPHWVARVWERVREEVAAGHQAYVVCPRISGDVAEQGERDQVDVDEDGNPVAPPPAPAAVEDVLAELRAGPLAEVRTAPLHGRLAADEKDATMSSFAAREVDVLVATTVIEVGVDVPTATVMVVLDADRFGVSQLHQLRGRVGRGGLPGLCLLVTRAEPGSDALARLEAVASTTDGFVLSQVDLETRREGDVLGASQSGRRSTLQRLRVLRDEDTILEAREAATALLADDPDLARHPLLAAAVTDLERSRASDFLEKA